MDVERNDDGGETAVVVEDEEDDDFFSKNPFLKPNKGAMILLTIIKYDGDGDGDNNITYDGIINWYRSNKQQRTKQIKTKKSSENKTAESDLPSTQLKPNLAMHTTSNVKEGGN